MKIRGMTIKCYESKIPDFRNDYKALYNLTKGFSKIYRTEKLSVNPKVTGGINNLQEQISHSRLFLTMRQNPEKGYHIIHSEKYHVFHIRDNNANYREKKTGLHNEINALERQIRHDRKRLNTFKKEAKAVYIGNRFSNLFEYYLIGGVHIMPNTFLNIQKRRRLSDCFESKTPQTNDNYIGLELECFTPLKQQDVAEAFFDADLEKHICIKDDGSINSNSGETTMEIVILTKESEYEEIIERVCEVLSDCKARVNKSCGFHVHLDMRNRNSSLCYNNLVGAQPILYAMNPMSRRNNSYCKKNTGKKLRRTKDRYKGINGYMALDKHNTIEIRIHSGTVTPIKIKNWVKLLLSIVNHKEIIKRSPTKLSTFVKRFNIDSELGLYIASRIELFAQPQSAVEEAREYAA